MDDSGWVTVGRVRTVFGVKGWLKVESFTEPAGNILNYQGWRLQQGGREISTPVDAIDRRGQDILVHLAGIDDREQAKQLANSLIQVRSSELPELEAGDYYWHELQGLDVYQVGTGGDNPQRVGRVKAMLETGANDVLVVEQDGAEPEILIPYLPGQVVKQVDLEQRRILLDWYYD